jgi:hypothetical protein
MGLVSHGVASRPFAVSEGAGSQAARQEDPNWRPAGEHRSPMDYWAARFNACETNHERDRVIDLAEREVASAKKRQEPIVDLVSKSDEEIAKDPRPTHAIARELNISSRSVQRARQRAARRAA